MDLFFHLVIEVKKSEVPWIVFKHAKRDAWEHMCGWNNLIYAANLPAPPGTFTEALSKSSLKRKLNWTPSGIHQAFKDPDAPSRWYSAFTAVCKAAEDCLEQNTAGPREPLNLSVTTNILENPTSLDFVQPLVILDGPLVSATLQDNGEVSIDEIEAAAFEFDFQTANYTRGSYRVDLISIDHLSKYSELATQRLVDIRHALFASSKTSTGDVTPLVERR